MSIIARNWINSLTSISSVIICIYLNSWYRLPVCLVQTKMCYASFSTRLSDFSYTRIAHFREFNKIGFPNMSNFLTQPVIVLTVMEKDLWKQQKYRH